MHQVVRSFSSRSGGVSQQQQQRRRCSSSASYSRLPPGTRYPPRLPTSLDFRKGGFVLRQPPPPLRDQPILDSCFSSVSSSTTTELITRHHCTLTSLRGRSHGSGKATETGGEEEQQQQDTDDVITGVGREKEEEVEQQQQQEEEQEEESEVLLVLSESSCSSEEEQEGEESESEQEVMSEEEAVVEEDELEEELEEDQLFAKDYLLRVRPRQPHDALLDVATLTGANNPLPLLLCCRCVRCSRRRQGSWSSCCNSLISSRLLDPWRPRSGSTRA